MYYNQSSGSNITMAEYLYSISLDLVRKSIYKLEFLRKDDDSVQNVFEDYVGDNSGSISITNNVGSRRSCNFTIRNYSNEFTDFVNSLSIGDKFKVYLGYEIDGRKIYFPQGVYCYSDPSINSSMATKTIEISGVDKWSLLDGTNGGILDVTYQVNKGSNVVDLIRETLNLSIVRDYIPPNLDLSLFDREISYDIIHDANSTIADIILEVAFSLSCYVYYDENGVFTMRPFEYDSELSTIYAFNDRNVSYISGTKTLDIENIYNAVKVISENTQNEDIPIITYLENTDLSDKNSVVNGNPLKIKFITEYTEGIDNQEKSDERARYELKKAKNNSSYISIVSTPIFHLVENTIVEVTDDYLGTELERFLINTINFTIGTGGTMSLDVSKASEYL